MLLLFMGLLGGFAFVFLTRLFWFEAEKIEDKRPLVTVAVIVLVAALLALGITGRLHWIGALIAGLLPFLRRGLSLLRFLPVIRALLGRAPLKRRPQPPPPTPSALTAGVAREILGLEEGATRAEIVAAHRKLMQRNHPDQGGSTYIAAQLNDARDLLLEELPKS